MHFQPHSRMKPLALAAISTLALAMPAAHAVSFTVTDGTSSHTCTLNTLSVGGTGNVSATVSNCTPALGGSGNSGGNDGGGNDGGGNDGGGNDGGGNDGGGNDGGGNDGGGNDGGGNDAGGGDPGVGLWSPDLAASPTIYVADQSSMLGQPTGVTRIPGCLNGGSVDNSSACSGATRYDGVIGGRAVSITLESRNILSVRFKSKASLAGVSPGYFRLANAYGGSLPVGTQITLTTTPGNMAPTNSKCRVVSSSGTPQLGTGTGRCEITPNTTYYLNIQAPASCTAASCSGWTITESAPQFEQ